MYPKQEVQVAQQFITYYRVSTQRQGASGLGLEAQRSAVLTHLAGSDKTVIEEFLEVETGKGSNALENALNCAWHWSAAARRAPPC